MLHSCSCLGRGFLDRGSPISLSCTLNPRVVDPQSGDFPSIVLRFDSNSVALLHLRMARRWKPKSSRYKTPDTQCTPHYCESLSVELWHIVFSFCLPMTLFAVRNTCHLFRNVVDHNNGALLARSPLNLPHPPPDPRFYMRFIRDPVKYAALRDFFGITDPWKPGLFGSAKYTEMLFKLGRCHVCSFAH